MRQYLNLTVRTEQQGLQVGRILEQTAGLSRRQISRAKFLPEGITRNGVRCRITETVSEGDIIRICLEETEEGSVHLEAPSVPVPEPEIIYEDAHILAVNKPAGIVTHPTGGHYSDTLASRIAARNPGLTVRPVGRLDKDTTGLVLFGKSRAAAAALQKQRRNKLLTKTYLAVVSGQLPEDSPEKWHCINKPLVKVLDHPLKMAVFRSGAGCCTGDSAMPEALAAESGRQLTAVTCYQALYSTPAWSLIRLKLDTGRTHQIRVHMAFAGHPLLGDILYGNPQNMPAPFSFSRAALHAYQTALQPLFRSGLPSGTGIPSGLLLTAPLPADFGCLARLPEILDRI